MSFRQLHHEDVKAAIRKKFGTVKAFQIAFDLPETGVRDVLRGGRSKRVEDAIESVIGDRNTRPADAAHQKFVHGAEQAA